MFKNVKIRHQLNILAAVIGGLLILLAGVYILLLSQIRVQSERSTALHEAALQANELSSATQYMAYNTSSYSLGHFENREQFNAHLKRFDIAYAGIVTHKDVLTGDEQAHLDRVAETRVEYEQAALALFDTTNLYFAAQTDEERAAQKVQQDDQWTAQDLLGRRLDIILSDLSFDLNTRATDADASRSQTIQTANVVGFALPVFIIGLSIVIIFAVRRSIANPVKTLTEAASRFAKRDYAHRTIIHSNNEFGDLGNAFNNMAGAIQQQIGEIEQARERAERSDHVKSAFLASMSHELRTPLNSIINFTLFVVEGDTGPVNEQQSELLTQVVSSARHLLNLINDVLDMSKIEANSLNLFIEENVNLTNLLNSAIATARSLLVSKPVRLQMDIEDNLPLMRADQQRILQILLNILANACKFTEEGEIKVSTHQANGEIVIAITDTGPGIATEDQPLVFEAFKQTRTGLRQGSGTGLGMPIAKSLAEAHGGRLWLESEYGHGAKFYVALPIESKDLVPTPV